jgi:hypothetical protein
VSAPPPMSLDEWVEAAVQAAVDQGFGREVEDPDVIDFIADIFASATPNDDKTKTS